jgi:tetratricopeptide (TPR) repeat protein
MKRVARKFSALAVLILLLVPVMEAADGSAKSSTPADSMTLWQARQTIVDSAKYVFVAVAGTVGKVGRSSIRFTPDGFEFDGYSLVDGSTARQHFKVDVKKLESTLSVSIKCKRLRCSLPSAPGKFLQNLGWYDPDSPAPVEGFACSAECVQASASFASAVDRLHALAVDRGNAVSEFSQQAATWRAQATKPPIPEEVRRQRLLAENAFKEKQLLKAMSHYDAGLRLCPTWPQGHFNAALISAELGIYTEAIEHMQAYLELVPDAADAQSARDQIVIWQDKAK